ncbi:MAG: FAD-binding oxidoreductase [Pseudomonadota bacterium]
MKVTRLPQDPGPAAWNALLPEASPPVVQEGSMTADWLIIGAGFAGLAAARRLSLLHPGGRIALIDAVRIGEGPAGRNSGFMIDLPHDLASENYSGQIEVDRRQIAANRAAIDFAVDAARQYGLPEEAIQRSGKLNAAASAKGDAHNASYAAHLSALGEEYSVCDARAMHQITGSTYYSSGLFTPHAAMIQPALFVRGVAAGLASNRVSVFENSPVLGIERIGSAWRARTPKGSVEAPSVILAVNGHLESFGFYKRQLMHVFTYASMSSRLGPDEVSRLGGDRAWGATPADPMGTTVRRVSGRGGDRIVIRNRFTYDPSMESAEGRLPAIGTIHDAAFDARFPMLKGLGMEYRWGGRLCLSRNDAPAFGEIDNGVFAACCQNGLGTTKGTFSGIAAADLASGLSTPFTAFMDEVDEPARLPPEPFARIGATAVIRFNEWRAGREF